MTALLLLLSLTATGTIRVAVEGEATEVVAFHRGEEVASAPVKDGFATFPRIPKAPVDLVALGETVRSEVVRHVRAVERGDGIDARLVARPAHRVTLRTEADAVAFVGGIRFPADRVLLLPGLHRVVVDHPRFVSSAARLLRVDRDLEATVALEPGLVVAGAVFGPDGKPLAGAQLDIFTDGFAAGRSTVSGEDGSYGLGGFRGDVVTLRVRAAGYATRRVRVSYEPGSERARLNVYLVAGATVALPVAGTDSAPLRATLLPDWFERALEEPRLRVNDEAPRSVGTGRVEFDGLTPGRRYRIVVECDGFLPASTAVFEAGATKVLPELTLRRGVTLRGTLAGPARPGGWGRMIVARGAFGDRSCRLDRNGVFVFRGLPEGKLLLLLRDLDERGTVVEVGAEPEQEVVLRYEVPGEGRDLEGTVLDAERKPLPGIQVSSGFRRALTKEDGSFRLRGLPLGPDRFDLRLEPTPASRAFRTAPHLPRVERKARLGIKVRAQLERAGSLTVRWEDARLARATLYVAGTAGEEMRWRIPRGANSLTVNEIPAGSYVIEVGAPGYLGTGGTVAQVGADAAKPIDVQLLRGRTVSGRIVRRRGIFRDGRPPQLIDTPVATGFVTLFDRSRRAALATAPIARDGAFLLEGLPAAPILLVAGTPGLPAGSLRVDLTKRDVENLVLPLFDPLTGGVKVTGAGGAPLPGANVAIRTSAGIDLRDLTARARFLGVVADDADRDDVRDLYDLVRKKDGSIVYRRFAPGNYAFHVTAPGYKAGVVRMRAREPWTVAHIGTILPGLDPTAIVPLRLSAVPIAPREEK